MADLENKSSDQLQRLANLLQDFTAYENNILPKVNLKRVKLSKLQNLTTIKLNDTLFNIGMQLPNKTEDNTTLKDNIATNPLRKKGERVASSNLEKKDVTFNFEAQIVQDDENVILSPSIVTLPPLKEDIVSTSGDTSSYIWPPVQEKKKKKEVLNYPQKKSKKNKPYFIDGKKPASKKLKLNLNATEKLPESEKTPSFKEKISFEEHKKEIEEIHSASFPWASVESEKTSDDDVFQGGLESELVDLPDDKMPFQETIKTPEQVIYAAEDLNQSSINESSTQIPIFKAIRADVSSDLLSDINNLDFSQNGIELQRKGSSMIDRKIILLGGLTVTLAYVFWTNILPTLQSYSDSASNSSSTSEKIVVRDLFSKQNRLKPASFLNKILKPQKDVSPQQPLLNLEQEVSSVITPITEQDRLSLIQRAKDAVEFRNDPFGQDEVLPPQLLIDKKLKEEEAEKPAPDIELQRKQVELVGVISTKDRDLALVNVYTADYAVRPEDEKDIRETKLKASLAMAVPNRLELSLLDPVEDWYVKQILKSKSRTEDPTIELVKGDKKFKLRVGQKLLLPEEG
jgi:hypothetical protein